MAEQQTYVQAMSWGRMDDGRFFFQVNMQCPTAQGKVVQVPVTTFFLTKEEEEVLKANLMGLHLASVLNGQKLD